MNRAISVVMLLFVGVAAQGDSLTLRIAAEPGALLPGIPPSLRIWISNDGGTPAEVPTKVALQVLPPTGDPFIAYSALRSDDFTMNVAAPRPFVLNPGETRDVSFWDQEDWFSMDSRFRSPGTFRIQLIADSGLDSAKLANLSRVLDQPGLVRPLISNEAPFTVIEPTGVDLLVWNAAKGRTFMCEPAVTELIWTKYPESAYAAYCVRDNNDPDDLKQIAGYTAALARNPPPSRAEAYHINIAHAWMDRGWSFIERDVDASFDAYEKARVILERVAKNAIVPAHRREAERLLREEVHSREEIVRVYNAVHGVYDRNVRTGVDCVQKVGDGRLQVWFGYINSARETISVPLGNDNKFTPPPFDRKQPTRFIPDIVHFAFSVVTKEPVLVWHLQGKATTFKLSEMSECPAGLDPADPSTWETDSP